jgi:hypothetical protein
VRGTAAQCAALIPTQSLLSPESENGGPNRLVPRRGKIADPRQEVVNRPSNLIYVSIGTLEYADAVCPVARFAWLTCCKSRSSRFHFRRPRAEGWVTAAERILGFARMVRLARPGGIIVLGVYNAFARIPLRSRRFVARLFGYRFIPCDPVLRDRESEHARRKAWSAGPISTSREHRHTLAEVQGWFAENGVEYLRACSRAQCCVRTRRGCSLLPKTTGTLRAGWRSCCMPLVANSAPSLSTT